MKSVIWIIFKCTLILNLITTSYTNENEDESNVYLDSSSNFSTKETSINQTLDVEQSNGDNDEFELEENIDEASSEIVESQVPFPTDKPSEIESEVPIRKPRRKRRRRRKRPRTSTHTYEEDVKNPVLYQEPLESDYAVGYVRRRPVKRRRRPIQRRPLIEGEEENILPRRKLIRRPASLANKTRNEDVKEWEPITSTEEVKWKPVKTTTDTTNIVSTTPKTTTILTTTTMTPKTTQKFIENNNKINYRDVESSKKSNSSRADMIVLHKRPINSNLPPTSAVIRRRLKPKNTTLGEITPKPKIILIKEELPSSLLPPGFIMTENMPSKESVNSTDYYQFNDEAVKKMMNEPPNNINNEFKLKSDTIPKVKDEILTLLKTKTGSLLLSNVLNLRNMSLEELLQHRERGSSQRHQELMDTKEEPIDMASDDPKVTENTKNFTNYLIETKNTAQNHKDSIKIHELSNFKLLTDNSKEFKSQTSLQSTDSDAKIRDEKENNEPNEKISKLKQELKIDNIETIPIQILKEESYDHEDTNVSESPKNIQNLSFTNLEKYENEELNKIKLNTIFEEKKVFSFPTTTTYITADMNNQQNQATSFVSRTPKTRIVLETSEREPRLFDSMPDFTIKTTQRPLITPTIPSQVLFIQDTNHLDKYQSIKEKSKSIDEDNNNNLEYRRFEMRKLPVAVKSAIIASAAILGVAILGFFVLLILCRMRQKKRVLRKKSSVFCQHNLHHDPDLRSSARSTSPVMDKHCQDQYYDGYGGRIDARTTADRQYYLWRTLRKTFRYD